MGKIVITTNMSLDGVVQDPDGAEGFSRGGWFVQAGGKDLEEWGKIEYAEALGSAALLLGRRSDEWFGTRWAARPGDFADRLNSLPKYVVSATLRDPRWTNVTVLKGDVTDEVTRLKPSAPSGSWTTPSSDMFVVMTIFPIFCSPLPWRPGRPGRRWWIHRGTGKLGASEPPSSPSGRCTYRKANATGMGRR